MTSPPLHLSPPSSLRSSASPPAPSPTPLTHAYNQPFWIPFFSHCRLYARTSHLAQSVVEFWKLTTLHYWTMPVCWTQKAMGRWRGRHSGRHYCGSCLMSLASKTLETVTGENCTLSGKATRTKTTRKIGLLMLADALYLFIALPLLYDQNGTPFLNLEC